MNLPPGQIPGLLKSLTNPGTSQEAWHAFGTMRVPWLEVECSDGLQVSSCCCCCDTWCRSAFVRSQGAQTRCLGIWRSQAARLLTSCLAGVSQKPC